MKEITKGIVVGVVGALICREFYVHGYNNGQDAVVDKINLLLKAKEAVEKEVKGES